MNLNFDFIGKVLRYLYHSVLMFIIIDLILFMFGENPLGVVMILVMMGIILASYIIRDYAPNNVILFLLHLIIAVVLYFTIKNIYIRVLFMILTYIEFSISNIYVAKGSKVYALTEIPWPTFFLGVTMYIFGHYMGNELMKKIAFVCPIILFVLYMLIVYVDGLSKYVDSSKDVAGLPLMRMLTANSIIVIGIIAMILVAVLLAEVINLDDAVMNLFKLIGATLKIVVMIFLFLANILEIFLGGGAVSGQKAGEEIVNEIKLYDNSLAEMMELLVKLLFIAIAVILIYLIVRRIMKYFLYKRRLDLDIVEKIVPEKRTGENAFARFIKEIRESNTNEEKLRALYREKIKKYESVYKPSKYDTSGEIKKDIEYVASDDLSEVTKMYENVRYGDEKVDKATIKNFKKLL